MPTKNQLSLTNILQNFKEAQAGESTENTKTASEEPAESTENTKTASEEPAESTENTKTAETNQAAEEPETADVTALKKIAQEAISKEDEGMQKEAEEFGTLFAHGFLQELEKTAQIEDAYNGAYQATTQAFEDRARQEKLAEFHDEAYHNTISNIAQKRSYSITRDHLAEKTAGELPMVLAGATQKAYDVTREVLENFDTSGTPALAQARA